MPLISTTAILDSFMRMRSLAGPHWRERVVSPNSWVGGPRGRGGTAGTSSEAYGVASRAIAIALGVSWLGLWAHEVYRVPDRAGLTPDGSLPMPGVLVGLLVLGRAFPRPSTLLVGARALGTLHLLGALLTVLPLGVLPFVPEQTPEHCGAHLVYAVAQVPLLWLVAPRAGRRA